MITKHEIILKLTHLFFGRTVEPHKIVQAISYLCECFNLQSALVYEADQNNRLNLHESFCKPDNILSNFQLNSINADLYSKLSNETVIWADSRNINASDGVKIFDFQSEKRVAVTALLDQQSHLAGLVVFIQDINAQELSKEQKEDFSIAISILEKYVGLRTYQNKLSFAQTSLERILDNTGIDIYVNDFETHEILYVNESMARPYGGKKSFIGRKCWEVLFPGKECQCEFCPQNKLIDDTGKPTKVYTWNYQRPFDGSWFRVFSASFRWIDGRLAHVVSSADITENKKNEELVSYLANFDSLTKLPNRRNLLNSFNEEILKHKMNDGCYLLFCDIDGFKAINDQYGHDTGDEFLMSLGDFFSKVPMLKDCMYRNGGDEFVAIITGKNVSEGNIISLANFLHSRFQQPWQLSHCAVKCNISIGVASYPDDGATISDLLKNADHAMYYVKKKQGGGKIAFHRDVIKNN